MAVDSSATSIVLTLSGEAKAVQHDVSRDFLVLTELKAPFFEVENRTPLEIVCVVDVSGSMAGDRIKSVCRSLRFIRKNLKSEDSICIVTYATTAKVVLPWLQMDEDGREKAKLAIRDIQTTGATNLCEGLLSGIQEIKKRPVEGGKLRTVMLFTDGMANLGYTKAADIIRATVDSTFEKLKPTSASSEDTLPEHPLKKPRTTRSRRRTRQLDVGKQLLVKTPHFAGTSWLLAHVTEHKEDNMIKVKYDDQAWGTTEWLEAASERIRLFEVPPEKHDKELTCLLNTFGFGSDHDADLLGKIASHGNGVYSYIKEKGEVSKIFANCLGGLLSTVSNKVTMKVEVLQPQQEGTPGAELVKLVTKGVDSSVDGRTLTVEFGDVQSEEVRDVVIRLKLPELERREREYPLLKATLSYFNLMTQKEETTSSVINVWRCDREECKDEEVNLRLNVQCNREMAADAMDEARKLGRQNKLEEARKVIDQMKKVIEESASANDAVCQTLIVNLNGCKAGLRSRQHFEDDGDMYMATERDSHRRQRRTRSDQKCYQSSYRAHYDREMEDDCDSDEEEWDKAHR